MPRSVSLSGSLLVAATTGTCGSLDERCAVAGELRRALLRGELPDRGPSAWPDAVVRASIVAAMRDADVAALCHGDVATTDAVVASILAIVQEVDSVGARAEAVSDIALEPLVDGFLRARVVGTWRDAARDRLEMTLTLAEILASGPAERAALGRWLDGLGTLFAVERALLLRALITARDRALLLGPRIEEIGALAELDHEPLARPRPRPVRASWEESRAMIARVRARPPENVSRRDPPRTRHVHAPTRERTGDAPGKPELHVIFEGPRAEQPLAAVVLAAAIICLGVGRRQGRACVFHLTSNRGGHLVVPGVADARGLVALARAVVPIRVLTNVREAARAVLSERGSEHDLLVLGTSPMTPQSPMAMPSLCRSVRYGSLTL